MHSIQAAILELAQKRDLSSMSLRKLGQLIGETHPQKIKYHLAQLMRNGFISQKRRPQSINRDTTTNSMSLISVPILGTANCGEALSFADELLEGFLQVSPSMIPRIKRPFAIKAIGNSMNRANIEGKTIENGDYVIVDSEKLEPKNGDYIVSIIDGLANIKKFIRDNENNQILLLSESSEDYLPIFIHANDFHSFAVSGQVKSIIKPPKL